MNLEEQDADDAVAPRLWDNVAESRMISGDSGGGVLGRLQNINRPLE